MIESKVRAGGTILDFGAGAGIFSLVASTTAQSVIAVDPSLAMLTMGVEDLREAVSIVTAAGWSPRPEVVHRVNGSFDCLQRAKAMRGFDAVLAIAVLEYLPDPMETASHLASLLRLGGALILTYPEASSVLRRIERPIDSAAIRVGLLTGSARLREREYDQMRPPPGKGLTGLTTMAGFELDGECRLALGLRGWRRYVRPTTLVTLRRCHG